MINTDHHHLRILERYGNLARAVIQHEYEEAATDGCSYKRKTSDKNPTRVSDAAGGLRSGDEQSNTGGAKGLIWIHRQLAYLVSRQEDQAKEMFSQMRPGGV